MKRKIIYAAVAVVLLVAVYFLFIRNSGEEFTLRAEKVSEGDITVFVTATGEINAVTIVEVGSQVSGTISKLYADYNSIVKEGQIIAQIDPTNLQQAMKDAEASLERGQAQYNESQRSYERVKGLYDKKLESQATYDVALTNVEVAKATLKQSQAQLERAKINLAYATIYAPINGVVIDRKVNVGQTVAASLSAPTLFTIANDLSKMQVQATVDESDIGKIAMGQEATFTVDAFTDSFVGKVSQIRLSPVIVSNVVNYTVVIDVANDNLRLMPGMTANIKIMVGKKNNVMKVPNIALRLQPDPSLVDTVKLREMREASTRQQGQGGNREPIAQQQQSQATQQVAQQGSDRQQSQQATQQQGGRPEQSATEGGANTNRQASQQVAQQQGQSETQPRTFQGGGTFQQGDRQQGQGGGGNQQFRTGGTTQQTKPEPIPPPSNRDNSKFGITQIYPQYQKSSVLPTEEFNRGRIWIKNSTGKLEPIFVRTGLNDGQFTEIITDAIKTGDEIIVGVISNNPEKSGSAQSGNPLLGGQQQGRQIMGGPPAPPGGRR